MVGAVEWVGAYHIFKRKYNGLKYQTQIKEQLGDDEFEVGGQILF